MYLEFLCLVSFLECELQDGRAKVSFGIYFP